MHHGTCVTHVPCYMSGSVTRGGRENVPRIPGTCATRTFTYLVRGLCIRLCCALFCCGYIISFCGFISSFLRRTSSNFCVEFQRASFKFHTKFWTHPPQNMHITVFYCCVWLTKSLNCDVISLREKAPWKPPFLVKNKGLLRPHVQ